MKLPKIEIEISTEGIESMLGLAAEASDAMAKASDAYAEAHRKFARDLDSLVTAPGLDVSAPESTPPEPAPPGTRHIVSTTIAADVGHPPLPTDPVPVLYVLFADEPLLVRSVLETARPGVVLSDSELDTLRDVLAIHKAVWLVPSPPTPPPTETR